MDDRPKTTQNGLDFKTRRMIQRTQPELRDAATLAGHHLVCRLPKCRRAKRCTGCHPLAEIGTTHYKTFPPCVHDDATQASLLKGWDALSEIAYREGLAAGYTPEELERIADDYALAQEESDDWPPAPPPPPAGASRHAARAGRKA
jgi:hypothetical protein